MYKAVIFLAVSLMIMPVAADEARVEISEDGWQVVAGDRDNNESYDNITTDVVPFNSSPDWYCNLRMQVGGLKTGDFNADGNLDLAVGCYQSQSYPPYNDWRNFILYNTGGQLEASPGWWSADASSTTEICVADFNNDGFDDIFSANGGFSFHPSKIYYYSDIDEGIQPNAGWSSNDDCYTTGADACDFDNDGDMDLATSNQGVSPDPYRPVHIFINDGGNLETTPSWSSSAEEISGYVDWGDYNQDGWADLAVSKWSSFYSCVYDNDGGYILNYPSWTANNSDTQKGVAWGDVNSDEYPELAIGASGMPTQLYPNNEGMLGSSPAWESNNSFHGCQDLRWADVDGDGDLDLATVHFSNGHLRIYLNVDGQLETAPSWQYDSPESGTALEFGDINDDGSIDLIMGASGDSCISVFYNLGPVSVDGREKLPTTAGILENYPNPFNASTRISFGLKAASHVGLDIYDVQGRLVTTLLDKTMGSGRYDVVWNGRDMAGNDVATGVYFYSLHTDDGIYTEKMMMLK